MARSVNLVILIGNLTRDPELRQTTNGRPVCSIGLATNRAWKTEAGEIKEESEFHKLILWGKLAETASKYLKKGMKAYFQGRIQTRSYTAKDGTTKHTTEIIAENMLMLSGAPSKIAAELGHPSHTRDAFIDGVFQSAGIPMLHIPVRGFYNFADLRRLIDTAIRSNKITQEQKGLTSYQ